MRNSYSLLNPLIFWKLGKRGAKHCKKALKKFKKAKLKYGIKIAKRDIKISQEKEIECRNDAKTFAMQHAAMELYNKEYEKAKIAYKLAIDKEDQLKSGEVSNEAERGQLLEEIVNLYEASKIYCENALNHVLAVNLKYAIDEATRNIDFLSARIVNARIEYNEWLLRHL